MKKLSLLLFATTLFIGACSNEFELTEDWKDITVVYGLLNQGDSVQYIRIEKAFLDPKTSAITIAQIADSLYYNNISVELRAYRPNGTGGSVYPLQRVNAVDEGFSRATGIFATSPNYLYKLAEPIDPTYTYQLVITKNDGTQITAETKICEDFELTSPNVSYLRFKPGAETVFRWNTSPNSVFFNTKLLINYKEASSADPTTFEDKTLEWEIENAAKPNSNGLVRVATYGEAFFQYLATNLEPGYIRQFKSIDLKIGGGAIDLLNYLEVGQANAGITGADIVPTYTNISGTDNYGLFSSRYFKTFEGFTLDAPSLDTLTSGYTTRNLGF